MRIRLSQPPAGDWLAGAWAKLGNIRNEDYVRKKDNLKNKDVKKTKNVKF